MIKFFSVAVLFNKDILNIELVLDMQYTIIYSIDLKLQMLFLY